MKIALGLVAAVLLAGCTTWDLGHKWTKPGVAPRQLALDDVKCRRLAAKVGSIPDLFIGGLTDVGRIAVGEVQRVQAYDSCMTKRGYARASDPSRS